MMATRQGNRVAPDARSANNSMALSANDTAASMTAWAQPDFGDGVVRDSGDFDSPLREFDAVSRRGGDAA